MYYQIARITKVGLRGTVVIPKRLCRRSNIERGSFIVVQETDQGILVYPAEPDCYMGIQPSMGIKHRNLAADMRVRWAQKKQQKFPSHDDED